MILFLSNDRLCAVFYLVVYDGNESPLFILCSCIANVWFFNDSD